eukprot:jgi/Picre1/27894/NNA_000857.t1
MSTNLLTTGTIEEKIFQRQINKEGLQSVVDRKSDSGRQETNVMSFEELRDLFSYNPDTLSTTYEHMVLEKDEEDMISQETWKRIRTESVDKKQEGNPKEDDLANWGLHSDVSTVPDQCLQLCGGNDVSLCFHVKLMEELCHRIATPPCCWPKAQQDSVGPKKHKSRHWNNNVENAAKANNNM